MKKRMLCGKGEEERKGVGGGGGLEKKSWRNSEEVRGSLKRRQGKGRSERGRRGEV